MVQISNFYILIASQIRSEWIEKTPQLAYLKKFFNRATDYKGRSSRSEFWWPVVFILIIDLGFHLVLFICAKIIIIYRLFQFIRWIYGLLFFLPDITIMIRRLHDVNKSGWWLFVPVIAFVAFLLLGRLGYKTPFIIFLSSLFLLVFLICYIILIVSFASKSVDVNNRYQK